MIIYSWIMKGLGQQYVGCDVREGDLRRLGSYVAVRNPSRACWHLVEPTSGAIVHTVGSRAEGRQLVKEAEPLAKEVVEQAKEWAEDAVILTAEEFFPKFRTFPER